MSSYFVVALVNFTSCGFSVNQESLGNTQRKCQHSSDDQIPLTSVSGLKASVSQDTVSTGADDNHW